jgi:hypothetical protein
MRIRRITRISSSFGSTRFAILIRVRHLPGEGDR